MTMCSPEVSEKTTLCDLLSHLTGLAPLLFAIIGKNAAILPRHEDVHACSKLPFLAGFRYKWKYDHWPYTLAARLIGHYLSRWEIFNVSFNKLAAGTFRGITCSLHSDPRSGPQVFI